MIKELVFLLEEPSARAMLEGLVPRLAPGIPSRYIVFEGKSDLERGLTRKIKAYRNPMAQFVIIRDKDSNPDCKVLKQSLVDKCAASGRDGVIVRILCGELETVYLADLNAVERGLEIYGISRRQMESKFRAPDRISSPSIELRSLTRGRYQKIDGSRRIGPYLDINNVRSPSFAALVNGIRRVSGEA